MVRYKWDPKAMRVRRSEQNLLSFEKKALRLRIKQRYKEKAADDKIWKLRYEWKANKKLKRLVKKLDAREDWDKKKWEEIGRRLEVSDQKTDGDEEKVIETEHTTDEKEPNPEETGQDSNETEQKSDDTDNTTGEKEQMLEETDVKEQKSEEADHETEEKKPEEFDWDSEEVEWDSEEEKWDPEEMDTDGWYHDVTELEETLNETKSKVLSGHVVPGGRRGEKRPDDGSEVRLQMEEIPFDTPMLLEDILSGAELKPTSESGPGSERQSSSEVEDLQDTDCQLFLALIFVMCMLLLVLLVLVGVLVLVFTGLKNVVVLF